MTESSEDFRRAAFAELHEQLAARGMVKVQLDEIQNPDPAVYADRPAVWAPEVQLSIVSSRDRVEQMIRIASVDQFKWGHPNTGERFPLPRIPLKEGSGVDQVIKWITRFSGFPSQELELSCLAGAVELRTGGAHGQFNYQRLTPQSRESLSKDYQSSLESSASVVYMDRRILLLDPILAGDLERQVGEGALALGAELLDRSHLGLEDPVSWGNAMRVLRARVEQRRKSMLSDSVALGGWGNARSVLKNRESF